MSPPGSVHGRLSGQPDLAFPIKLGIDYSLRTSRKAFLKIRS